MKKRIFDRIMTHCSGNIAGLHLLSISRRKGCFITPCTHPNGIGYRLNYFDRNGLNGHENYGLNGEPYTTLEKVLEDAIERGFIVKTSKTIDTYSLDLKIS